MTLNEMYMGLHVILLFVLAIASLGVYLLRKADFVEEVWVYLSYQTIDFTVSCMIAFILYQVSGKKKEEEYLDEDSEEFFEEEITEAATTMVAVSQVSRLTSRRSSAT